MKRAITFLFLSLLFLTPLGIVKAEESQLQIVKKENLNLDSNELTFPEEDSEDYMHHDEDEMIEIVDLDVVENSDSEKPIKEEVVESHVQTDNNEKSTSTNQEKAVLNSQAVTKVITEEVIKVITADEIYEQAISESSASRKFALFVEGFENYPNDPRFHIGVQESGFLLLNWARGQHNQNNFSTAIDRYRRILDTSSANKNLKNTAQKHLDFALQEKHVSSANELHLYASQQTQVSATFLSYVNAYEWYPEDSRFHSGLQTSAKTLYEWAVRQHDAGNFETAISRYETILSVEVLNSQLKSQVIISLNNAKAGVRSANSIYNQAIEETSATRKFSHFIEGMQNYPEDSRFNEGLQSSTVILLNWARRQHNQGDLETAIDRYERILNVRHFIQTPLVTSVERHLAYAKNGRTVPHINDLLLNASQQTQVSATFLSYIHGYEWYPDEVKFINGVQESAQHLFEWAIKQHNLGNFETALSRYETLLHYKDIINSNLHDSVKAKRGDAILGKRPANVIIEMASNESSATRMLSLFIEGYEFYPSDKRFANGIRSSADLLINWTFKQHQHGNFDVAISRYQFILEAPEISKEMINRINLLMDNALNGLVIPTPEEYVNIAFSSSTLSERLRILLEGYSVYEKDRKIENGINKVATDLLNWATNQHINNNFETAIQRYELILSTPSLSERILNEASLKLSYAEKRERLPTANQLFEHANKQTSASHRFSSFINGFMLYPNEKRFLDGINSSARLLLNWATSQHNNRNFEVAVDRYERILNTHEVNTDLKIEAEVKLSYAIKKNNLPSANSLNNQALNNTTASGKFDLYALGYLLYPNDTRFQNGLYTSAQTLLDWARSQHLAGKYSTATDRYTRILSSNGVNTFIKETAKIYLNYSTKNSKLPSYIILGKIQDNSTTIRNGTGSGFYNIGSIDRNSYVEVLSFENDGWLKIRSNNIVGYIQSQSIKFHYISSNPKAGPLSGKVIVLDPGHGGRDPGASANGIVEKELVLDVALRTKKLLEDAGAIVIMTRTTDIFLELAERAAIANSSNADIFISIHANKFNGSANGTETFYHSKYERNNSSKLAHSLQSSMVSKLGTSYRRVAEGDYHVIRETTIPSALIELGFMDHSGDAAKLKQTKYRNLAAEAILEGIKNYFYK